MDTDPTPASLHSASPDALPSWTLHLLCRYLTSAEIYFVSCASCGVLTAQTADANMPSLIRHLRLLRNGGDSRDALALDRVIWEEIESLQATQNSLHAVHDGLMAARSLIKLDVELLFPEILSELLPQTGAFMESLRTLTLRKCYTAVLGRITGRIFQRIRSGPCFCTGTAIFEARRWPARTRSFGERSTRNGSKVRSKVPSRVPQKMWNEIFHTTAALAQFLPSVSGLVGKLV